MLGPEVITFAVWHGFYEALKYWGPIITFFGLLIKSYKTCTTKIEDWADKVFTTHLSKLEIVTTTAVQETRMTNELLAAQAIVEKATSTRLEEMSAALKEYQEKQAGMWTQVSTALQSVTTTLTLLEDRTKRSTPKRRPSRNSNAKR